MATPVQLRMQKVIQAQRRQLAKQTQANRALVAKNARLVQTKRALVKQAGSSGDGGGAGAVPLLLGMLVVFSFLLRKGKKK